MKELTNYFVNKNIIFKELNEVFPKDLKSRKKVRIYDGIGVDKKYYAIFILDAKSRFLRKNANDLMDLCNKLIDLKKHNYKKKELLISSPLCSHAKKLLKDNGWGVRIDFM
ncbi:MAG: hypothetical protein HRT43_09040 [Campylobacteraceae bacterium]|nr:hypothetical protein [Campylobacteraceae bacterium]